MALTSGLEHIVRENTPLAEYTKLKIGGSAQFFAEPTDHDELVELVKRFHEQQIPIRLIGEGSNVLVRDEGVQGLVIRLSAPAFGHISVNENQMTAGGGARLAHFVSTAVREGFSGPENLIGIPGTIGGALHVNIGSEGFDIGNWVRSARVLTLSGQLLTRDADSLSFSYRQSSLNELVILDATFEFEREDPQELTRRMQKLWIVRRADHPVSDNSLYAFKDHGVESAADILEQCGLKGARVGDAEISDRDPNTVIAHENATAADVIALIEMVCSTVKQKLGIDIESAIEIW